MCVGWGGWEGGYNHFEAIVVLDTTPFAPSHLHSLAPEPADKNTPQVRRLAEYLLGDALAVKAPLLAYNHFVEAIFVLNNCRAMPAGKASSSSSAAHGGGGGAIMHMLQLPAAAAAEDGAAEQGESEAVEC
jgi:hypothetical protein